MSDSSPLAEPLLSKEQTIWLLIALVWFVIGSVALADGRRLFGAAWPCSVSGASIGPSSRSER